MHSNERSRCQCLIGVDTRKLAQLRPANRKSSHFRLHRSLERDFPPDGVFPKEVYNSLRTNSGQYKFKEWWNLFVTINRLVWNIVVRTVVLADGDLILDYWIATFKTRILFEIPILYIASEKQCNNCSNSSTAQFVRTCVAAPIYNISGYMPLLLFCFSFVDFGVGCAR